MGNVLNTRINALLFFRSKCEFKIIQALKRLKLFITQKIFTFASSYPLCIFIFKPILKYLGYSLSRVSEPSRNSIKKLALYEEQTSCLVLPGGHQSTTKCPSIEAFFMHNVLCSSYIDGVIGEDGLYYETTIVNNSSFSLRDSGGVVARNGNLAIVAEHFELKVKKGILVNSIGAYNWYHFIVEALPKLNLVNTHLNIAEDWTLLVPDECRSNANFNAALALFSEGREIVYLERGQLIQADELLCLDPISKVAFNLRDDIWPKVYDHIQNSDALLHYSGMLRHKLIQTKYQGPIFDKVFLARRADGNRNYNQDELEDVAKLFGFTTVYLDEYSLRDQYSIISNANYIIGPSGAAWTCLLFAHTKKVLLTWLPIEYEEFSCFSNLAQLSGSRLDVIFYTTNKKIKTTMHASRFGYKIEAGRLKAALENL